MDKKDLIAKTEVKIRFNEVDSLRVVWHGSYVKYLEDGRDAFGEKYGIHYLDFLRENVVVPLVHMELDYKRPLKFGEKAIIETKYVDCDSAKLIFEYTIYRSSNREEVATGRTIQVFLNTDMELMLTVPDFFVKWKEKYLSA